MEGGKERDLHIRRLSLTPTSRQASSFLSCDRRLTRVFNTSLRAHPANSSDTPPPTRPRSSLTLKVSAKLAHLIPLLSRIPIQALCTEWLVSVPSEET